MICGKSELCIFDHAPPQVVVDTSNFEEIFTVNTIGGSSDVEFNIVGSTTDYLDLNDTILYIKLKVVKGDGKDLVETDEVRLTQYAFCHLFKDVILSFNNVVIEGGNGMYASKAVLESLINYSADTKKTSLNPIGYETHEKLQSMTAKSKIIELCGSLQLDFFDQPKYLIPGVNVHIRLKRNDTKSVLVTNTKDLSPEIQLLEAKLIVRRVKVEQAVSIGHQLGLEKQNACYPIQKTSVVHYSLGKGASTFYKDQIFGDMRLPKFVLIAFQAAKRDYATEASDFKNYDVASLQLSKNSDYRETYVQDFNKDEYTQSYVKSIIRNLGYLNKNTNVGISRGDFRHYYPLFTFVLTPDFDINQTQLPSQGNLRLDIKFNTALEQATSIIIYGLFDHEIQITKNGTILL